MILSADAAGSGVGVAARAGGIAVGRPTAGGAGAVHDSTASRMTGSGSRTAGYLITPDSRGTNSSSATPTAASAASRTAAAEMSLARLISG